MNQEKRRSHSHRSTTRLLEVLFVIGIGLEPVYLFPSGGPQVGDWILAFWAALALLTRPSRALRVLRYPAVVAALILVVYITLVNVAWAFYLVDWDVAFQALFYVYNFLVVWALVVLASYDRERWRRVLASALVFACLVMLVMFVLRFDPGRLRQTAGFSNPNQLGYYSLLFFCAERLEISSFLVLSGDHSINVTICCLTWCGSGFWCRAPRCADIFWMATTD